MKNNTGTDRGDGQTNKLIDRGTKGGQSANRGRTNGRTDRGAKNKPTDGQTEKQRTHQRTKEQRTDRQRAKG